MTDSIQENIFWDEVFKIFPEPSRIEGWKDELSSLFDGMTPEQARNAANSIKQLSRKSLPAYVDLKRHLIEVKGAKKDIFGMPLVDEKITDGVWIKCPEPDKHGVKHRLQNPYFIRHNTEQFKAWDSHRLQNENKKYLTFRSDVFGCEGWYFPAEWPEHGAQFRNIVDKSKYLGASH